MATTRAPPRARSSPGQSSAQVLSERGRETVQTVRGRHAWHVLHSLLSPKALKSLVRLFPHAPELDLIGEIVLDVRHRAPVAHVHEHNLDMREFLRPVVLDEIVAHAAPFLPFSAAPHPSP